MKLASFTCPLLEQNLEGKNWVSSNEHAQPMSTLEVSCSVRVLCCLFGVCKLFVAQNFGSAVLYGSVKHDTFLKTDYFYIVAKRWLTYSRVWCFTKSHRSLKLPWLIQLHLYFSTNGESEWYIRCPICWSHWHFPVESSIFTSRRPTFQSSFQKVTLLVLVLNMM